jgi:hypothetical protein
MVGSAATCSGASPQFHCTLAGKPLDADDQRGVGLPMSGIVGGYRVTSGLTCYRRIGSDGSDVQKGRQE